MDNELRQDIFDLAGSKIRLNRVDCNNGWYLIVRDMIDDLRQLCIEHEVTLAIDTIKEKFATLSVYPDFAGQPAAFIDACESRILKAVVACGDSCDVCGDYGKLTKIRGFIAIRCPQHETT